MKSSKKVQKSSEVQKGLKAKETDNMKVDKKTIDQLTLRLTLTVGDNCSSFKGLRDKRCLPDLIVQALLHVGISKMEAKEVLELAANSPRLGERVTMW
jgi:hypothetical protein